MAHLDGRHARWPVRLVHFADFLGIAVFVTRIRTLLVCLLVTVPLGAVSTSTAPASATSRTGAAPGRPGTTAPYLGSDKAGFGTAESVASHVWFTLEPGGGTGEVYFPTADTPAARSLGFVVADGAGQRGAGGRRRYPPHPVDSSPQPDLPADRHRADTGPGDW